MLVAAVLLEVIFENYDDVSSYIYCIVLIVEVSSVVLFTFSHKSRENMDISLEFLKIKITLSGNRVLLANLPMTCTRP